MAEDFIKVTRSLTGKVFYIEVYFEEINSTIKIELKEVDFLSLLLQSANLYNEKASFFKLFFSQEKLDELINQKRKEAQQEMAAKLKPTQVKPIVEVRIFIPDEYVSLKNAEEITNASGEFMEALGFKLETEDEPVFGSFFKRLKYIFSSTIGDEDLIQLYGRGKKALELKHLDLPTAEQTEKLANSAEKLVKSLEGVEEGVVRCGALIVIKKKVNGVGKIFIQQLSMELIIILDKKPQLLFNVNTIYELLTGDVQNDIDDTDTHQMMIA